jgi:hypothetical protein
LNEIEIVSKEWQAAAQRGAGLTAEIASFCYVF